MTSRSRKLSATICPDVNADVLRKTAGEWCDSLEPLFPGDSLASTGRVWHAMTDRYSTCTADRPSRGGHERRKAKDQ